jgi:hypothetical protein
MMRDPAIERSRARFFDVPLHLYRQGAVSLLSSLVLRLKGDTAGAFSAVTNVAFAAGFIQARRREYLATTRRGLVREITSTLAAVLRPNRSGPSAPA